MSDDVDPRWSCNRKIRYDTERGAARAMRDLADRGREGLNVYGCGYCGGWHIGHEAWRWRKSAT